MGNVIIEDVQGLALMKTLPFIMEPMISQMVVDKIVLAEIYLRLLCGIAGSVCGWRRFYGEPGICSPGWGERMAGYTAPILSDRYGKSFLCAASDL